ncbi:MAG: hypothetical protein E6Q97_22350 [Desulfurellales bacterium]|nr:MAG: hypothetical protein E6Q97_22350 [Desulfurellales bacterium]
MFSLFRRTPSPYAVAIRDSLINEPERWTMCPRTSLTLDCGDIQLWTGGHGLYQPRHIEFSVIDRRCIREGIEAWIAWSLTRKETT